MQIMDIKTSLTIDFDRGLAKFTILSEIFHILEKLTTSKMLSSCINVKPIHCPKIIIEQRST